MKYLIILLVVLSGCNSGGSTAPVETKAETITAQVTAPTPTPTTTPIATTISEASNTNPVASPSPSPTSSPCSDLSSYDYGMYKATIYNQPSPANAAHNDTIKAYIFISFNHGNYSFDPSHTGWQGFQRTAFANRADFASSSLTCEYAEGGARSMFNSYCPDPLTITQDACPQHTVTITGNFQAVYPTSGVAIPSTQTFTLCNNVTNCIGE